MPVGVVCGIKRQETRLVKQPTTSLYWYLQLDWPTEWCSNLPCCRTDGGAMPCFFLPPLFWEIMALYVFRSNEQQHRHQSGLTSASLLLKTDMAALFMVYDASLQGVPRGEKQSVFDDVCSIHPNNGVTCFIINTLNKGAAWINDSDENVWDEGSMRPAPTRWLSVGNARMLKCILIGGGPRAGNSDGHTRPDTGCRGWCVCSRPTPPEVISLTGFMWSLGEGASVKQAITRHVSILAMLVVLMLQTPDVPIMWRESKVY